MVIKGHVIRLMLENMRLKSIKTKYDDFVTCIFHEMVHVKQYIRKELYPECAFWKTREEYLNLPWEIEAYKKPGGIVKKTGNCKHRRKME